MKERDIERYLVAQVKARGGEVRKLVWPGRKYAPDRVAMLPVREGSKLMGGTLIYPNEALWIELKAPGLKATFPSNAHERGQAREHEKMRKCGQVVLVIDSKEEIDKVLR